MIKYEKDKHPALLTKHLGNGGSIQSFGGFLVEKGEKPVVRKTVHDWLNKYPEMKEAKEIGDSMGEYKMEQMVLNDQIKNTTPWIFFMKNRFGWKDKQEFSGDGNSPLIIHIAKEDKDL